MAKQLIKLTEGDLHRIIENAVRKIALSEDWKKSYDAWKDHAAKGGDQDEGSRLSKKWSDELKSEHPEKTKRREAFNQYAKSKDSESSKKFEKDWKKSGGEERFKKAYSKKYGVNVDDSAIDEAIRRAIGKLMRG